MDETLLDYVQKGYDVFEVAYKPPFESPLAEFFPARSGSNQSRIQKAATWIARTFVRAVEAELTPTAEKQAIAMDDTMDRTRS